MAAPKGAAFLFVSALGLRLDASGGHMLLRRIIAHFRKQEWTAIAIDFVIVVVGVLVGLQVNDWATRQADARRGEAYVQRLIADVELDLENRRRGLVYYDAVYEGAVQTNALLRQSSPDPRGLVINAYRATEYSYTASSRATWDEIVSSGDVGLLPTDAAALLGIYFSVDTSIDAREVLMASPYRLRVRRTISFEVQDAIRRGCSDARAGVSIGFSTECVLEDVSEAEIAAAAAALRRDPEVLADLRYQFSELSGTRANIGGDLATLNAALEALRRTQ